MGQWYYDDEPISKRPEDDLRPNFKPPLQGTGILGTPNPTVDPDRPLEIGPQPSAATGLAHGARESIRGTAGLIDLAGQALDFFSPYGDEGWGYGDEATGFGLSERANAATAGMVPEGYEPRTQGEKLASLAGNAGTSFAVPGMAGLGPVRGLPSLVSGGLKGYAKSATTDVGSHAARLAAANVGGSGATQLAEEYAPDGPLGTALQLGAGLVGGVAGDAGAGAAVRSIANRGGRKAAQGVKGARPTRALGRLVEGVTRRLQTRMGNESYTDSDVMEARDAIMQVLFGRLNRITDADLEDELATRGYQAHQQLSKQKKIMDDVFDEIELYAALYDKGIATPSLLGILRGADLAGSDLTRMARLQGSGQYGQELRAANENALQRVIEEAEQYRPAGASGETAAVRDAALSAQREAYEVQRAPYQKPPDGQSRMREILTGGGQVDSSALRLRQQDINKVFNESMKGMELTTVGENAVSGVRKKVDDLLEGAADEDGMIPLFEYDGLRQELGRYARDIATPDAEKVFIQTLMGKIDDQIENRLKRGSRELFEEYITNRRAVAEYHATHDQKLSKADANRLDPRNREMESGVAKALGTAAKKSKEETADLSTANELLALSNVHSPGVVADQIRKVMRDDIGRMQEVEASIWNRIYAEAVDPGSTHAQVKKKQQELQGPAYKEGDSNLMALYRELAGDEKADAVEDLIKRARSSRADDTSSFEEAYRTNSGTSAQIDAAGVAGVIGTARDAVAGNPASAIRNIVTSAMNGFSDDISEQMIANAIQAVQLNPRALLELLSVPSKKEYLTWKSRWIARPTKTGARESAKSNVAEEIGD